MQTIKVHKKVGVVFAHTHVEHKLREEKANSHFINQKQFYKCGNQFGQNHLESCLAKDKICSKIAKRGHFAKCVDQDTLTR